MRRYQDIQISEVQDKMDYTNFFNDKNYQSAWDIIDNNPQLNGVAFTAELINDITNEIQNLENYVTTDVDDFLEELNINFDKLINEFILMQDYNSSIVYQRYNFVYYNDLVYMYINSAPSSGKIPTNTSFWVVIGLKGNKGAGGCADLSLKGQWISSALYTAGDLAIYGGAMWVVKKGITIAGSTPPDQNPNWQLFIQPEVAIIDSSIEQPVNKYLGAIWFEMIPI